MNYFIKISILFLFFAFAIGNANSQYDNLEIVKSGKHSKEKVLSKTAVIRFSKEFSQAGKISNITSESNFRIVERMLKKDPVSSEMQIFSNPDKAMKTAEVLGRTYVVQYDENIPPHEFCKNLLQSNPAIELAEPYRVPQFFEYFPNDNKTFNQVVLDIIQAFEAWGIYKGSEEITIGISDSGCDQDHEDLKYNIAINEDEIDGDMIDNDNNGYIDDYRGYNFSWEKDIEEPGNTFPSYDHGTKVAGIAAASTDNNKGIAGTGFKSRFFPLKISDNSDNILHGYQSIIYAADNGFDVLNMSWGSPGSPSEYEQSVIDYAVARDVALVASAGNKEFGMTNFLTFYPAGYRGVLGVGESDYIDMFVDDPSMVGVSCDILAMSDGNHTTKQNNGYTTAQGGTSFSAPVVSGVVAIARGMHPDLNAIQAIELVRQTGDDVTDKNFFETDLLPKRVNMLNAIQTDPMSIPAIVPQEYHFMNNNLVELNRFLLGDTVKLKIDAKNYLKSAENLTFKLSVGYDSKGSVEIINDEVFIESIENDETKEIGLFAFEITSENNTEVIFRLDITDENGYSDFRKFGFKPTQSYTTFSNDNYTFTLSDFGYFGNYVLNPSEAYGVGFEYKDYGNQIYQNSGIIAAQGLDKGMLFFLDDYMPVKPFAGDDPNIGIVNDGFAPSDRRIGIDISQEVIFDSADQSYFAIKLKVRNSSKVNLEDIAVGYFIDWDISADVNNNYTELLPEAIPDELQGSHSAAQLAGYADGDYPIFGMAVSTQEKNSIAQSAGLIWNQFEDLKEPFAINLLNGGTSFQNSGVIEDIGIVSGMKFNGKLVPDQTKECKICFAGGETKSELINSLKECLGKGVSVRNESDSELSVYPQPASDNITISTKLLNDSWTKIRIFDVFGNDVLQTKSFESETDNLQMNLDISDLHSGRYFISVSNGTKVEVIPLTVVK